MDAIELLTRLGPLASQYGWPAVFAVLFAPKLLQLANAHIELVKALREELPRIRRQQRIGIKATKGLTLAIQEMGKRQVASPGV